jgi:hypothetical protein
LSFILAASRVLHSVCILVRRASERLKFDYKPLQLDLVWSAVSHRGDFSALTISYKAPLYDAGIPPPDGSRRPFSGEPEDIAGDIRTFAAIGVHELIFDFRGRSITESIERLQWFAAEVIPLATG